LKDQIVILNAQIEHRKTARGIEERVATEDAAVQHLHNAHGNLLVAGLTGLTVGLGDVRRLVVVMGVVVMMGLVGALPVLFAGAVMAGLITAVISAFLLYLLWDKSWQNALIPVAIMASVSLIIGFLYIYLHAFLLRNSLFFQPTTSIETLEQLLSFRVIEASQAAGFITTLYWFVFALIVAAAFVLGSGFKQRQRQQQGMQLGYMALVAAVIMLPFLIANTNRRVSPIRDFPNKIFDRHKN